MPKTALIIGATSAMAQATCRALIADGYQFFLVGRHAERLAACAADLKAHGAAEVKTLVQDAMAFDQHQVAFDMCCNTFTSIDLLLIAHGELGDQTKSELEFGAAQRIFDLNFTSAASYLTIAGNYFEREKRGQIVVISSVAGDRGRQSNYVYGAAKAALSVFTAGLRNRLAPARVQVLTVKPGFVDSPMTAHLPKGPLYASPQAIALGIIKALRRGSNEVYLPWFWAPIMLIVCSIPEFVFKRLRL